MPVGLADFKELIELDYCYIDKTLFIKEIMDKGDKILLIPRPRRFGKTLNLSMVKYFYDCCPDEDIEGEGLNTISGNQDRPNKKLFDSLNISRAGNEYMDKQGKHPVIFISFRNIRQEQWELSLSKIKTLIHNAYLKHDYLLNSPKIKPSEKVYFQKIVDLEGDVGDYEDSLEMLLIFLYRFYQKRVVILIDEYDQPIHAGYNNGYYDEVVSFMRNFLSGGLKDTGKYLEKGIVTGIMRIAKESIFSGLNNPGVYTLTKKEFDDKFGFTESEVKTLLKDFGLMDRYSDVRKWYNGYRFGKTVIYNPWSIINFLGSEEKESIPYWLHTSNNSIVENLLTSGGKELKKELEVLISGGSIQKTIEENIVLKAINRKENLLWSFLLMGGYLKQTDRKRNKFTGRFSYSLSIPNLEVREIYITIVEEYFSARTESEDLENMLNALVEGDIKRFEMMLKKIVLSVFSFHDFGNKSEKVYHALVAGLLIWMTDTHEIKSNRESGYGRYDIMIVPRDPSQIGYVIEFKTVDKNNNETMESALKKALKQIEDKKYETELVDRGIKQIKKLAIAFSGKDVSVKEAGS